jgi:ubiquinone/menaquinone biosynthesis C-methylase UbiE
MLSQVARNVIGIDNSNDALALAHGKYALANLSFAQMNATDLRFSNESFDTVCSFEVIEHIEDYDRSLSEIARVLNKNGKLIMSTPNHAMACDRSFVGTPYHVREFYLHEFRECLSEHFGNVEICAQGDYFSNISKFLYLRYGKRFYETTLPQEQFNIEQVTISKENLGSAMVFVAVASK